MSSISNHGEFSLKKAAQNVVTASRSSKYLGKHFTLVETPFESVPLISLVKELGLINWKGRTQEEIGFASQIFTSLPEVEGSTFELSSFIYVISGLIRKQLDKTKNEYEQFLRGQLQVFQCVRKFEMIDSAYTDIGYKYTQLNLDTLKKAQEGTQFTTIEGIAAYINLPHKVKMLPLHWLQLCVQNSNPEVQEVYKKLLFERGKVHIAETFKAAVKLLTSQWDKEQSLGLLLYRNEREPDFFQLAYVIAPEFDTLVCTALNNDSQAPTQPEYRVQINELPTDLKYYTRRQALHIKMARCWKAQNEMYDFIFRRLRKIEFHKKTKPLKDFKTPEEFASQKPITISPIYGNFHESLKAVCTSTSDLTTEIPEDEIEQEEKKHEGKEISKPSEDKPAVKTSSFETILYHPRIHLWRDDPQAALEKAKSTSDPKFLIWQHAFSLEVDKYLGTPLCLKNAYVNTKTGIVYPECYSISGYVNFKGRERIGFFQYTFTEGVCIHRAFALDENVTMFDHFQKREMRKEFEFPSWENALKITEEERRIAKSFTNTSAHETHFDDFLGLITIKDTNFKDVVIKLIETR